MSRRNVSFSVVLALCCLVIHACDPSMLGGGGGTPDGGSDPTNGGSDGSGSPTDDPSSGASDPNAHDSVGDVTTGGNSGSVDPTGSSGALVAARVRNESGFQADVTLRFIADNIVTHLAFLRIQPETMTTVTSAKVADIIEASGSDERGAALERKTLVFGVDFDDDTPAEYVIRADGGGDAGPDEPSPEDAEPPTILMTEPSNDVSLPLGSTLLTRWADESFISATVVRIFLQPMGSGSAERIPVSPAVNAALDGINDELEIIVQQIDPGSYEIVGEIDDGFHRVSSVAPGVLQVVEGDNAPPTISIVSPSTLMEVQEGESIFVRWTDEDPDDNASISFSLVETNPNGPALGPFVISPPIAEDPDGISADSAVLTIGAGIPAGLYDLLGTIDDGDAVGTARKVGVVRVLSDAPGENQAPQMDLVAPAEDIQVDQGQSFRVAWTDADPDDNAQISIVLEPDPVAGLPNRPEVLLVSSLDEDDTTDEITLGIPTGVAKGAYRVRGEISDGVVTGLSWAPGLIFFGIAAVAAPQVTIVEPAAEVRARVGQSLGVRLMTTNAPAGSEARLYLSNLAYGGDVRVDVTPPSVQLNDWTIVPIHATAVPNLAWPRRFDLDVELLVGGMPRSSDTASGSVWIRQEVEVTNVVVNYTCPGGIPTEPGGRVTVGVKFEWIGGGYEERDVHNTVRFWLTQDGLIPPSQREDLRHRLIHTDMESPGVPHEFEISLSRILLLPIGEGDELPSTLDPGQYFLLSIVDPPEYGTIISEPYPEPIDICLRIR